MTKIRDSVLASGPQPPASVTKKIPVFFGAKFDRYRQKESSMEAAHCLKITLVIQDKQTQEKFYLILMSGSVLADED